MTRYYLYVIRSLKDKKLYIGVSSNPEKSTKYRRPFVLLYTREFGTRKEAYKYEWFVKNTGTGNKNLKAEVAKVVTAGL